MLRWLASALNTAFDVEPIASGASQREFLRLTFADGRRSLIMRSTTVAGDTERFVQVARLMAGAGINVPQVIACDLAGGFALMTDLGSTSYSAVLNNENADQLIGAAIKALVRLQRATEAGRLPVVGARQLRRELRLFRDWYLDRHLRIKLTPSLAGHLDRALNVLIARVLSLPFLYAHRDYTARNLMVCDVIPGVLDVQDAALSPITTDLASLCWSSSHDWPSKRVHDWISLYWNEARRASLPVHQTLADFATDLEWSALHRHLKNLGVFARPKLRDNKSNYLEHAPRIAGRIRTFAESHVDLIPLIDVMLAAESADASSSG